MNINLITSSFLIRASSNITLMCNVIKGINYKWYELTSINSVRLSLVRLFSEIENHNNVAEHYAAGLHTLSTSKDPINKS